MDTMTVTKVASSLCGALLVFLLVGWAASGIYSVGGHGEAAYVIDTGATEGGAEEEAGPSFDEVLASADPEKGAKVFKKCAACHKLEVGENATGPYLAGVVGRPVAGVDGFGYSDAMQAHGGEWTPEALNEFLTKPAAAVPGTAMGFAGLPKIGDRADLVAYLQTIGG
ncbi:MAG: cytochrome c family protein [Rhodobacteraceae bacterium]|nr:cytochrome c family protein [Paracoccaceae bacterium]MAY44830.1 cytochrome c family protein [Paracoccaceae bacterium]QEW18458.1 Cytochrome c552 [Marinibacterium anthonyi]